MTAHNEREMQALMKLRRVTEADLDRLISSRAGIRGQARAATPIAAAEPEVTLPRPPRTTTPPELMRMRMWDLERQSPWVIALYAAAFIATVVVSFLVDAARS